MREAFQAKRHGWLVLFAIIGSLSAVMLTAGCGSSAEGGITNVVPSAVAAPDTITVLGTATVTSAPDEAVVTLTVESDGADPAAAMNANSSAVNDVLERLKAEGVEESAIETTNVTVYPNRQYNPQTGEESLIGYRAQNSVSVTLEDAEAVSRVLSAAVEAGVNNFSGPVWRLREDSAAVAEALKQAVADAQSKAEALAGAQGVKVGNVIMMNEGSVQTPVVPLYSEAYDLGAGESARVAPTPISAATLDVTATVTVTYALNR